MNKNSLALTLLLASPLLWAETIDNQINRAVQESREQLNNLQQQNQQRWIETHRFQTESDNKQEEADLSQVCLPYSHIKFVGFSLIDPQPFAPKEGECLNEVRLNELNQALTKAYLDKGYIHNPLQFEDDHSGALTLRVKEGTIAKLSSDSKRFNVSQILQNPIGRPLKVQDLDQALDQANRIPGNNVSVDVLPAKNGEIELAFTNEETKPFSGYIGLDNYASKNYNRWQTKAGVSIGNPFGLSDTLSITGSHTLYSTTRFSRSALLYYSLPYGYWTFNGFISASQFKAPVILENSRWLQSGRTIQAGLNADYVFHRGSNHISTFSTQVERIDSKNRFAGEILNLQSPILTSVQLGFNHLQLFENANLVFDFRHEQGWNKRKQQAENKFNKWNMSLQFTRYQTIGSELFQHRHQLTGQYSLNYLPAVKQEDLTGRYRVRGFKDLSSSAERNIVLQNTFSWIYQKNNWQVSPYLMFDLGLQKSKNEAAHTEKALSYGAGSNFTYKNLNVNLELSTSRLYNKNQGVMQERSTFVSSTYSF